MDNSEELITKTQAALSGSEEVKAAGVFALADDYKAIAVGGATTSLLMPSHSPLGAGLEAGATIEGTRQVMAAKEGVTARMLVAVTEGTIFVFGLGLTGTDPQDKLFEFDRETTEVVIKKWGLSRHLNITEEGSEKTLKLTGDTMKHSASGAGDRRVLAELAS